MSSIYPESKSGLATLRQLGETARETRGIPECDLCIHRSQNAHCPDFFHIQQRNINYFTVREDAIVEK